MKGVVLLKKTSWTLVLLIVVLLTTVGFAYGQAFELFGPLSADSDTVARLEEKSFSPPQTPLGKWLQRIPDPPAPDYAGLLLARADEQAALAAAEDEAGNKTGTEPAKSVNTAGTSRKPASNTTTQPEHKKDNGTEKPTAPADPPPEENPVSNPLKPPAGTAPTAAEKKVFDLVNHARVAEGLSPLILSTDLVWLARLRCEDLVAHGGTLTHNTPTYGSSGKMLKDAGISFKACGENLAKTVSAERAVERWLASEKGHRENMLSTNFTHTGVGIARLDSHFIIISQLFINK